MKDLPGEFAEAIPRILTESCFGDFYTRGGLDTKTRELMIFCALATLGADRQLASHAIGNMKVGNDKETLISAMVQCYPYIGFPRIANVCMLSKKRRWKRMFSRIILDGVTRYMAGDAHRGEHELTEVSQRFSCSNGIIHLITAENMS